MLVLILRIAIEMLMTYQEKHSLLVSLARQLLQTTFSNKFSTSLYEVFISH